MTTPVPNEIVQALTGAVRGALDAPLEGDGLPAARDVAQVLGLDGLDRALDVCRPGDPRTDAIVRRLRALCDLAIAEASLAPFMTADTELAKLAVECGEVIEGEARMSFEGTLTALEALDDLPLADDASRATAARVRLTAQVAAALRAALDWLGDGMADPSHIRLRAEDSALEVALPRVNIGGVAAAAKVIAAIGGNLGPVATTGRAAGVAPAGGAWMLRVPIATSRATYLMVSQNGLELALPWHAVLRLCMTPRAEFDAGVMSLGLPLLAPLVPLETGAAEYPVVLVAHGVKRAYFVADRLVWRLPAEPCETGPDPRAPRLIRTVRTDDGTVYRVADPAVLLDAVEPLTVEPAPAEPRPVERESRSAPAADDSRTIPSPSHARGRDSAAAPAVAVLAAPEPGFARDVAPFDGEELPFVDPARVSPLALRALIAEDSISARLGLVRLLQDQLLDVHAVSTARELADALELGPWALVCVDAELPDARGADWLASVRAAAHGPDWDADVVALVRDGIDEAAAIEGGIVHTLRKPWGRAAVERLLDQLDLSPESE